MFSHQSLGNPIFSDKWLFCSHSRALLKHFRTFCSNATAVTESRFNKRLKLVIKRGWKIQHLPSHEFPSEQSTYGGFPILPSELSPHIRTKSHQTLGGWFSSLTIGPKSLANQNMFDRETEKCDWKYGHTHRIHGAAIYGNMDPINIPHSC